jgi:tetratricopeptide (TPR) repeat protein
MKRNLTKIFFIITIIFLILSPAFSQLEDVRLKKAQVYIQGGSYKEAVEILEKIVKAEPNEVDARYLLGLAYRGLRDFDKAEAEFMICTNLAPDSDEVYLQLASVQADKKDFKKAEETLSRLLVKNPKSALGHYGKGVLYYIQKDVPKAITEFLDATIKDRKMTLAFANLGYIYFNQRKFDQAVENFAAAAKLDETNPEYPFATGWTEWVRGNKKAAYQNLNRASRIKPPHAYSVMEKVILAYDEGKDAETLDDLKELFLLNPEFSKGLLIKARMLAKEKKYAEAEEILKKLIEGDPLDQDAADDLEKLKPHLEKQEKPVTPAPIDDKPKP